MAVICSALVLRIILYTTKMKLPILLSALPLTAVAWTAQPSSSSAFTGRKMTERQVDFSNAQLTMYESPRDPPDNGNNNSNMWAVLANTERWLSDTLASQEGQNNPFTRKEVSYVCENNSEAAMITAGIFRRLREAREQGETHGRVEEERLEEQEEVFSPRTLRQTQVIVVPSNEEYVESFPLFDTLIESINQARRDARDLVTDISLEKLDETMYGEGERDWSVSVNCAHLHPSFGEQSPEEQLEEMKQEDEEGEVDLNLKAYKEKRLLARRSPYPTVVVEVRSTPPPDFTPSPEKQQSFNTAPDEKVTNEDIQRLEALFGKSPTFDHPTKSKSTKDEENDFYNAIGQASGIDEVSLVTPLQLAQTWIAQHDDKFDPKTCTFTETDTKYVDSGYEFVFTNLAMQTSIHAQEENYKKGMRQYLVMSNFLSASATSFEKFATQAANITKAFPGISGKVQVSTLHPEHVDHTKRAPVPVFVWTWE